MSPGSYRIDSGYIIGDKGVHSLSDMRIGDSLNNIEPSGFFTQNFVTERFSKGPIILGVSGEDVYYLNQFLDGLSYSDMTFVPETAAL